MLSLQNISYTHPNKDILFNHINLTVNNQDKVAIIGNNGIGKTTLLKIIAKELLPSSGQLDVESDPYYIPQIFGQYNHLTIAQALRIADKLHALKEILEGSIREENFNLLNDDWTIEDRCDETLDYWQLKGLDLSQKMGTLSGGQKTKVFLAAIFIHKPQLILLDEPSNHLDTSSRQLLYDFMESTKSTLLLVSHDRKLLNLSGTIGELGQHGIRIYGGNYDFYEEQKQIEHHALNQSIQNNEKALRKAEGRERETLERQQKLDTRGKRKQEKSGVARIMMNTLRNNAENSTSKLKSVHAEKIDGMTQELQDLRTALPDLDKMKFGIDHSQLHKGKILFVATNINFAYNTTRLWRENLSFQIVSGERIALKGQNGSGKTTLIKLISGDLEPQTGAVHRAKNKSVYIDQDYSLLDNKQKVYEQAQQFNNSRWQEHEIKTRLNRFLFARDDWDKPCSVLSGGERMRLMLCCLTIDRKSPDILILDEPTNNLDMQNVEMLTEAINEYRGTVIVVSHDEAFLERINIERTIELSREDQLTLRS
ncbi:ribosomal protection-like ABC-F family protein [Sphingobacterium arenae]|uniref:ABC-F family ATP-binding cassette domain-containing protein n=1 Tax=Sphingobacterium arenae TaxID=1280598 RepID=A0ABR7XYX8_9SPHI|nr:ABC-F family ATP-binding cassette domain-containing protein [Sphingobacterium arenae]MBD1424241.1 ABC-F family ATP-binding cassette domain-containing protein [Sphingobacterium arenae]